MPGRPRYRYVFLRDAGGRITGFAQRREAWDLVWKRNGLVEGVAGAGVEERPRRAGSRE